MVALLSAVLSVVWTAALTIYQRDSIMEDVADNDHTIRPATDSLFISPQLENQVDPLCETEFQLADHVVVDGPGETSIFVSGE